MMETNAADAFCIEGYNKNEKNIPEDVSVAIKKAEKNVFYERIQVL